jgi:hypothetical protein
MHTAQRLLIRLVLVLILAAVFTWYFQPGLLVDLSTWLATCMPG